MTDDDAPQEGDGTEDTEQVDEQDQPDEEQPKRQTSRKAATRERSDDADNDGETEGKTFTQADVDKLIADRIARERKKFADYGDLKTKAKKLSEIEDAQKSETDRLNDQLTAAQVELQGFKVEKIRREAATEAGLDPELAEYITAADPDEALAQARKLADRLKAAEPKRSADLKQGARTQPQKPESRDELLRGMAGFGRR